MNDFADEGIKQAASVVVSEDFEIHERVRDLTLAAIKQRRLEAAEIKNVVKALTEGITLGLGKRGKDSRQALAQAFSGLDAALMKSAEATQLALQQLAGRNKDFSKQDLKAALDNLQKVEHDFLSTVSEVASKSSGHVKAELEELLTHTRRTGTDTGRQVAATLAAFSQQMHGVMNDTKAAGSGAAHKLSSHFTQLAAGILEGIAQALRDKK
jgi:predicted component of type VI protein secretion system